MAGVWVNTVMSHLADRSMLVGLLDGSGGEEDGSQPHRVHYRVHYTPTKHLGENYCKSCLFRLIDIQYDWYAPVDN